MNPLRSPRAAAALLAVLLAASPVPGRADKDGFPDLMKVATEAEPRVAEYLRSIGVPMDPAAPVLDPVGLMDIYDARKSALEAVLKSRGLALDGPDQKWKELASRFIARVNDSPPRVFSGDEADLQNFAQALYQGPFTDVLRNDLGGDGILSYQPVFRVKRYTTVEDYMNQARQVSIRLDREAELSFLEPSSVKGVYIIHLLDRPGVDHNKAKVLQAIAREVARGTLGALHPDWGGAYQRGEYTPFLLNAFLETALTAEDVQPVAAAAILRNIDPLRRLQAQWLAQVIVDRMVLAAGVIKDLGRRYTLNKVIFSLDRLPGEIGRIMLGIANLTMGEHLDGEVRASRSVALALDADLIPKRGPERDSLVDALLSLQDVSWVVIAGEKDVSRLREAFMRVPMRRCSVVPGLVRKPKKGEEPGRRLDLAKALPFLSNREPRVFALSGTRVAGMEGVNPVFLEPDESLEDGLNFLVQTGEVVRSLSSSSSPPPKNK